MSRTTRAVLGAAAALATTAAVAAPANASLVVPTTECATPVLTQPFTAWGDTNHYKLVDGGTFEDGATGWQLRGGAKLVAGNEPSYVNGADDASSLQLPAGSTAVSAPVCVGHDEPTMRFFVKRNSGVLSTLAVGVQFQLLTTGLWVTLPVGVVGGGGWAPSPTILTIANLLPAPGEYTNVRFVFAPLLGGDWQIDDVYADPRSKF